MRHPFGFWPRLSPDRRNNLILMVACAVNLVLIVAGVVWVKADKRPDLRTPVASLERFADCPACLEAARRILAADWEMASLDGWEFSAKALRNVALSSPAYPVLAELRPGFDAKAGRFESQGESFLRGYALGKIAGKCPDGAP